MSTAATSATPETIFMLRISLKHIKPEVWRRVLVPGDYTFKELHDVIMAVMGWSDFHMHRFSMNHPVTNQEIEIGGVGDLGYGDYLWLPESTKIAHYIINPNQKVMHEYDFGSPWYHIILFEKTIPAILGEKYPKCIGGKRVPPPEDDPGSDYSDSEHLSKDFDHTRVNFGRCRPSIVKSPQKEVCQFSTCDEHTGLCSEVEVSKTIKKKTSEAKKPPAKRMRVIHIKSHTSTAGVSTSKTTVSNPVVPDVPKSSSSSEQRNTTVQDQIESEVAKDVEENPNPDVSNSSSSSEQRNTSVQDQMESEVAKDVEETPNPVVPDVPNSSSSSEQRNTSVQDQMESEVAKDVEDDYGKYIASQMMLVPDLEAREELRSVIQNAIEKYRLQKK